MSDEIQTRTIQELNKCLMVVPRRTKNYQLFDQFVEIVLHRNKQIDWEKSNKNLVEKTDSRFSSLLENNVIDNIAKDNKDADKNKYRHFKTSEEIKQTNLGDDEKELLNHLEYIWTLGSSNSKPTFYVNLPLNDNVYPQKGLWSTGGFAAKQKFTDDFAFLVHLVDAYRKENNNPQSLKSTLGWIENFCLNDQNIDGNPPIRNALLHLSNPDEHAPIFSTLMKDNLLKNFNKKSQDTKKREENIKELCVELKQKLGPTMEKDLDGFLFYLPMLNNFLEKDDDGISDVSILNYKKSIILYGPPGTSKTYSAEQMAKSIGIAYAQQESNWKVLESNYIRRLQLHPNYSYEDFIWGYAIKNGKAGPVSSPKKGFFLNLLEEINKSNEESDKSNEASNQNAESGNKAKKPYKPYILILDEINRVDLSRLFGELFSAIENREKNIELPVRFEGESENYKICIPSNLYIIGTMNEIDFSLERIDFALRRRFAWIFKGYDENVLEAMLAKDGVNNYDDYIKCCTELNNTISSPGDLGKEYAIGHVIYAEVSKICNSLCANSGEVTEDFAKAKNIVWNISIKPLLEAYMGNADQNGMNKKIKQYENIFFNKKTDSKDQNG